MRHRAQRRKGERNEPYGGKMKSGEGLLATPPAEDDPGRRRFNRHSAAGAGRRGIAQAVRSGIRAGAASATALLVIGSMAWVASGRLDATWPARNVLEARLRAGAPVLVGSGDPNADLPGSIEGRVTWRTTAPTPCPVTGAGDTGSTAPTPYPPAGRTPAAPGTPVRSCVEGGEAWSLQDIPIPGAVVLVADGEGNVVESRSDASGSYVLGGLYAGRYRVVAAAPGFVPVVVDRPLDASPFARLVAWVMPGVAVGQGGVATVHVHLERPSPPPAGAFARDMEPDTAGRAPAGELVACNGADGGLDVDPAIVATRLPVRLTGTLAGAPVASLRRYAPPQHGADRATQGRGDVAGGATAAQPSGSAVVAVVPVGSEEDACAAIRLAARGVDVIVAGIAPDPRVERQVLAVRTLLAGLRARDQTGMAAASPPPPPPPPPSPSRRERGDVRRGPIVVGAGFAAAITMRAVADEAADVPMDWAGVRVDSRAPWGSAISDRIAQRNAAVERRVGGVVLVAPVLDLLAVRRELPDLGLPGWLAEAAVGLGPVDRELPRYIRYSARFTADVALPPVIIVPGASVGGHQDSAIAEWVRFAGGAGVSVEVMPTTGAGQPGATPPWGDEATLAASLDRIVRLAGLP